MDAYELIPVTSEDIELQSVLRNLTKMYCYEWSGYLGMDVDSKGEFVFEKHLPKYWSDSERKAFLLGRVASPGSYVWAGFALLDRDFIIHKDYDYSMAEFFVMPVHRRHGVGRYLARTLFDTYRGRWELGLNPKNLPSVAFWDSVIAEYTKGNFEYTPSCPAHRFVDGTLGDVFAFDST